MNIFYKKLSKEKFDKNKQAYIQAMLCPNIIHFYDFIRKLVKTDLFLFLYVIEAFYQEIKKTNNHKHLLFVYEKIFHLSLDIFSENENKNVLFTFFYRQNKKLYKSFEIQYLNFFYEVITDFDNFRKNKKIMNNFLFLQPLRFSKDLLNNPLYNKINQILFNIYKENIEKTYTKKNKKILLFSNINYKPTDYNCDINIFILKLLNYRENMAKYFDFLYQSNFIKNVINILISKMNSYSIGSKSSNTYNLYNIINNNFLPNVDNKELLLSIEQIAIIFKFILMLNPNLFDFNILKFKKINKKYFFINILKHFNKSSSYIFIKYFNEEFGIDKSIEIINENKKILYHKEIIDLLLCNINHITDTKTINEYIQNNKKVLNLIIKDKDIFNNNIFTHKLNDLLLEEKDILDYLNKLVTHKYLIPTLNEETKDIYYHRLKNEYEKINLSKQILINESLEKKKQINKL